MPSKIENWDDDDALHDKLLTCLVSRLLLSSSFCLVETLWGFNRTPVLRTEYR